MTTMDQSLDAALETFRLVFGGAPEFLSKAPGRINLIGEHTDYQDGFCLPGAIDAHVRVLARRTRDDRCRIVSMEFPGEVSFATSGSVVEGPRWGLYAAGTAWALRDTIGSPVTGVDAVVASTLPPGSGLSSSAAIETAFARLWDTVDDLQLDKSTLARVGQTAEHEAVGNKCGIMDQTASVFGIAGHLLLLDTADPESVSPVPVPEDVELVVCDTGVKHELVDSEYNMRRQQVEEAARLLGVRALRWVDVARLDECRDLLGTLLHRRARHVVTECARVLSAVEELQVGNVEGVGRLMDQSHASLRDDYEVSCIELDAMAKAARSSPGCLGARQMGGGFGGSCIALLRVGNRDAFCSSVTGLYEATTGRKATVTAVRLADGARCLRL